MLQTTASTLESIMPDEHAALVIGGGVAGIQASLDLANHGFKVYLIEKEAELGGTLKQLSKLFPTLRDAEETLKPLLEKAASNKGIKVITQAEVRNVQGSIGDFKARIGHVGSPDAPVMEMEVHADVIILATGFRQYDAHKLGQYRYGEYRNVVTGLEYEVMLKPDGPTQGKILRPDNGQEPKSVAFILCAGSRDEKHLRYCCNLGCLNAIKHAHLLHEQYGKEVDAYVCYIDVRAVTKVGEQFYNKVRDEEVEFIHGQPSEVRQAPDGTLTLDVYDQATSKLLSMTADLVVLEMGLQPNVEIAEKLRLGLTEDGFIVEKDPQLSVTETNIEGIFLAGAVQQPMHSYQAVVHASAAALKAISALQVH
jgi:heterodisulfide reductase subunit A-like polyferredoxin